jgi:hypothetical protein
MLISDLFQRSSHLIRFIATTSATPLKEAHPGGFLFSNQKFVAVAEFNYAALDTGAN